MIHERIINMKGLAGQELIQVPTHLRNKELVFISILNLTDNSLCLYPPEVSQATLGLCRLRIPAQAGITIPLLPELRELINVIWSNDNTTNTDIYKQARVFLTDVNLNINFSMAASADYGKALSADVTNRAARELGIVTAADGGVVALGAKADAAVTDPTATGSGVALLKGLLKQLQGTGGAGALPTTLTGRRLAVARGDYSQVLNVAGSGGVTSITITPASGELWRVKSLYASLSGPSGAASGTHTIYIRLGTASSYYDVLTLQDAYNLPLQIAKNYITSGATKSPTDEQSQILAVTGIVVTNANPLILTYLNNTNVTQTGTFTIHLTREVEYIVS